jgi:hypothetical protein
MENKNQPAYPVLELKQLGHKMLLDCAAVGFSKRELVATKLMAGMLASYSGGLVFPKPESIVPNVIKYTDYLLSELEKPQP